MKFSLVKTKSTHSPALMQTLSVLGLSTHTALSYKITQCRLLFGEMLIQSGLFFSDFRLKLEWETLLEVVTPFPCPIAVCIVCIGFISKSMPNSTVRLYYSLQNCFLKLRWFRWKNKQYKTERIAITIQVCKSLTAHESDHFGYFLAYDLKSRLEFYISVWTWRWFFISRYWPNKNRLRLSLLCSAFVLCCSKQPIRSLLLQSQFPSFMITRTLRLY